MEKRFVKFGVIALTLSYWSLEVQHVLWHTEAEQDPLPSETGPQGSVKIRKVLWFTYCSAKQ